MRVGFAIRNKKLASDRDILLRMGKNKGNTKNGYSDAPILWESYERIFHVECFLKYSEKFVGVT